MYLLMGLPCQMLLPLLGMVEKIYTGEAKVGTVAHKRVSSL
jgi:hypothetical protein